MIEADRVVPAHSRQVKSKTCFKCEKVKPLDEFYTHSEMADGHLNKCKKCTRKDTAERVARLSSNPEWALLERARHRLKSAKARLEGAAKKLTAEQRRIVQEKFRDKHPEKHAAHDAVSKAIRSGKLVKQPCETCGATARLQAHHDDYSKPLDVRWFCIPHHNRHHVLEREKELVARLMGKEAK